jgi:hypothetical protein
MKTCENPPDLRRSEPKRKNHFVSADLALPLRILCPFLTNLRTSRSPTITSAGFDVNRGKSPIRKSEEQGSGHTPRTSSPTLRVATVRKAELAHREEWKRFRKHHHRSLPDEARSSKKEMNQQIPLMKLFTIQFYIWFLISYLDSNKFIGISKPWGVEWNWWKWDLCSRGHYSSILKSTENSLIYYNHNQGIIGTVIANINFMNFFEEFPTKTEVMCYLLDI